MKILLVAAGRRYSFIERLQNEGFEVFSYEYEKDVPISKICKVYSIIDPNKQFDEISTILEREEIPFILPLSCEMAYRLNNTRSTAKNLGPKLIGRIVCGDRIAYDKQKFEEAIFSRFPEIYPVYQENMDYVIKPRFGNGSKGVRFYKASEPINHIIKRKEDVSQRLIVGTEYSVDAYFSKFGEYSGKYWGNSFDNYVGSVPRTRDRVSNGEVIDSTTIDHQELQRLTMLVGQSIGIFGPACFQYIVEDSTNKPYLIEINARFGGGCILSLESGFNIIDLIKREYYYNERVSRETLGPIKWGLQMKRVNRETFFQT